MEKEKEPAKIIMIVNGEPIEMCAKTLSLCNTRSQNVLLSLKSQSLEKVHTMRLFWGDVVMLNILTNQLLQKVDSLSLARVLKPTTSLEDDLEEYRNAHKAKVENLKNALIIANDGTLPLDYSRELEKYFAKQEEEANVELDIDKIEPPTPPNIEPPTPPKTEMQKRDKKTPSVEKKSTKKNKNIYKYSEEDVEDGSTETKVRKSTTNKNTSKTKESSQHPTPKTSQKRSSKKENIPKDDAKKPQQAVIVSDDDEMDIGFLFSSKKVEEPQNETSTLKEEPVKQENKKDELEMHQEAFTSFGTIDINSLFN